MSSTFARSPLAAALTSSSVMSPDSCVSKSFFSNWDRRSNHAKGCRNIKLQNRWQKKKGGENELCWCQRCLSSHTSRGVADGGARGGDFGDSGRIVRPRSPTNLDLQVTVWVDLLHTAHLSKGLWENDGYACDCWLGAMLSASRPTAGRGTMEWAR